MPHLFLCDPRVIVEALLREIFPKSARNPQFSGGLSRLTIQVSQGKTEIPRRNKSEGR